MHFQPGPLATFGELRVSGQPPFSASHVARIARFETGEPFKRSQVDDLRRALIATGLVASAEVGVVPGRDGHTVDLAVRLEPAPETRSEPVPVCGARPGTGLPPTES